MTELPHRWRKPANLERWLVHQFPTLQFVCRYLKVKGDWYMSIKAVEAGDYARLRYFRYIPAKELVSQSGVDLLLTQLYLVQPP